MLQQIISKSVLSFSKVFRVTLLMICLQTVLASAQPRSVTVTINAAQKTELFNKSKILNVARGGHGINKNLAWMPSFYSELVNIGVNEFRIDWLFSDYYYQVISKNSSGQLVFDFTRLDSIIIPLLEKNITPVMCMCYMTNALADSMQCQPRNYELYKKAVKEYVKHYKSLGYTGLSWESHNEPEGFTILTAQQTYKMYEYFTRAVNEEDPSAKVGGFGSVGHDWIGYLRDFLTEYKNDNSKPSMDFFSFHQYGKYAFEYVPEVEKCFTDLGLAIPDLYITEWNNSFGQTEGEGNSGVIGGGFDSHVNASYVAMKFIKSLSYKNLKKIFYWNFADTDSGKQFCGESGLFTVDNHRKAAANTFDIFNRLYGQCIQTSISDRSTSGQPLVSLFTIDEQTKSIAGIICNYNNTPAAVDLSINNMSGLFSNGDKLRIKTYVIDSTHCSFYYDYKNGYRGTNPGPNEKVSVASDSTCGYTQQFTQRYTLAQFSTVLFTVEKDQQVSIPVSIIKKIPDNRSNNSRIEYELNGRCFINQKIGLPQGCYYQHSSSGIHVLSKSNAERDRSILSIK